MKLNRPIALLGAALVFTLVGCGQSGALDPQSAPTVIIPAPKALPVITSGEPMDDIEGESSILGTESEVKALEFVWSTKTGEQRDAWCNAWKVRGDELIEAMRERAPSVTHELVQSFFEAKCVK